MDAATSARFPDPSVKLACGACNSLSYSKRCARPDETKKFTICPSCKILGNVSLIQADEELAEKVRNYLMDGSTSSSASIQYDFGLDLIEEDASLSPEYLRYTELSTNFVKVELTTKAAASVERLFAVLKNICSAYLILTKECLMALNALATIPNSDSLVSSCMSFLSSSKRSTIALPESSRLVAPISSLTRPAESKLLEVAMRLMDTVEICLKTLDCISNEALRSNEYACDDLLNLLCDNLRSFRNDKLIFAEGDQPPRRPKLSTPLEIRDPTTNRLVDLHRFGQNETSEHVRRPGSLAIIPAETENMDPNQSPSRMSKSAPSTPNFGNVSDKRITLEIRDPNTNELIELPAGSPISQKKNDTKKSRPNHLSDERNAHTRTRPLPVAIVDPKTGKPISLPGSPK